MYMESWLEYEHWKVLRNLQKQPSANLKLKLLCLVPSKRAWRRTWQANPLVFLPGESPIDGGAWWATVVGSQTVIRDWVTKHWDSQLDWCRWQRTVNVPPNKSNQDPQDIHKIPCVRLFSHVWFFSTPLIVACQTPLPWDYPGKNIGVDCYFLHQDIFPTQGLNPGLQHCQADSDSGVVCLIGLICLRRSKKKKKKRRRNKCCSGCASLQMVLKK